MQGIYTKKYICRLWYDMKDKLTHIYVCNQHKHFMSVLTSLLVDIHCIIGLKVKFFLLNWLLVPLGWIWNDRPFIKCLFDSICYPNFIYISLFRPEIYSHLLLLKLMCYVNTKNSKDNHLKSTLALKLRNWWRSQSMVVQQCFLQYLNKRVLSSNLQNSLL